MGATLSGSPKFVLSDAATKNFNMTGAISMQCLQNHRHFGNACRCNDFGKSAAQRRQSAHASASDLHGHQRDQRDQRDQWERDANNNAGNKHTGSKTLPYVPSGAEPAALASMQPRYHYQHQMSTGDRPSTHGYLAEPLKPSKSLASLKESARANGQLASEGVVGLPALKPKLTVSPTGAGRPLRPHSQAFSASQSMNQLRVTHPAVINSLNGTLAMASRRVSSIFTKKHAHAHAHARESAGRHVRSITVDNTTTSSSTDAQDSQRDRSAMPNAPGSRSSMLVDTRERGVTEKENSAYENAPSHNYRQPIPKSISCYNIKSQQQAHGSAEGGAADTTHSAQPESRAQNRKTILQASTTELLHYLSEYIYRQIPHLHSSFRPVDVIAWIRSADKNLILQGWSDINFINPANVVFLFMMLRNVVDYREVRSVNELHTITMTCLYLAYSYMGNEISYPLKPFFLSYDDRDIFWQRCVDIINLKSASMLRLNTDPAYFAETFAELKGYSVRTADSG